MVYLGQLMSNPNPRSIKRLPLIVSFKLFLIYTILFICSAALLLFLNIPDTMGCCQQYNVLGQDRLLFSIKMSLGFNAT